MRIRAPWPINRAVGATSVRSALAARQTGLTEEDWNELDEAFGTNRDPFAGAKVEADLGRLFAMIVKAIREP